MLLMVPEYANKKIYNANDLVKMHKFLQSLDLIIVKEAPPPPTPHHHHIHGNTQPCIVATPQQQTTAGRIREVALLCNGILSVALMIF